MIDPVTDALVAAGIAKLGAFARGWVAGDPTQRLTAALAERVDEGQFRLLKFEALERDLHFRALISESLRANQFDDAEARRIIARHVDDIRGHEENDKLAGEIAALVRSLLPLVADKGTEAGAVLAGLAHDDELETRKLIQAESAFVRNALEQLSDAVAPIVLDPSWLSGRAGDAWVSLLRDHPKVAAELRNAVGDEPTAETVAAFIELSQRDEAALWEAVVGMADELGEWTLLERASLRYAEAAGGNRARGLAWAAGAADLRGDAVLRDDLLAQAESDDPHSPSLQLVRARISADPQERLAILDDVEPVDDRQRAALEGARAVALFETGQLDAAFAAAARAKAADPDDLLAAEVEATLVIADAQAGRPVTWPQAATAIAGLTRVRSRLLDAKRFDVSVQVAGKIGQAHLLVGNYDEVRKLADDLHAEELGREEATGLAGALVAVGEQEKALGVLPAAPVSDEARLTFVAALLDVDSARFLDEGIPILDRLLQATDTRLRAEAAWIRTGATLFDSPAPESPDAVDVLEQFDPLRARLFAAAREERTDLARADEILAAGGAHAELLVERGRLAVKREDWPAAQTLFAQAVALDPTPINELAFAHALREAGDARGAQAKALEVARRGDNAPNVRNQAYRLAYGLAQRVGDMQAQSELASEWFAFDPENEQLAWSYLFTLIQLARYRDARALIERKHLEPRNRTDAEIYAEILVHTTTAEDALQDLLALSEQFGTDIPAIEGRLAMLTLVADASMVPPEALEQAIERLESYPDRFPKGMERIEIDPADPLRAIQPHLEARARVVEAVSTALTSGDVPIAALAAATGRDVGSTTLALNILPLGFGSSELDALELDDARAAIGNRVVLESTTLTVAGGLGSSLFEKIRRAFTEPTVPQAVVDDSRFGARDAATAESNQTIGFDLSTGQPYLHEHSPSELAREENRAKTILTLLDGLTVVPNVKEEQEGRIGAWVREQGHAENTALHTAEATLAVAERLRCAVYSDDRVIRNHARRMGMPAFGTATLLQALRERGVVTEEEVAEATALVLRTRAWGVPVDLFDSVGAARVAGWNLTSELAALLTDRGRWNEEFDETLDRWHNFLRAAAPEASWPQFWRWVFRVVDAAVLALPGNEPSDIIAVVALHATKATLTDAERSYRERLLGGLNFVLHFYGIRSSVGNLVAQWQQKVADRQADGDDGSAREEDVDEEEVAPDREKQSEGEAETS